MHENKSFLPVEELAEGKADHSAWLDGISEVHHLLTLSMLRREPPLFAVKHTITAEGDTYPPGSESKSAAFYDLDAARQKYLTLRENPPITYKENP